MLTEGFLWFQLYLVIHHEALKTTYLSANHQTGICRIHQFLESMLLGRIPHFFAVVRDTSFPIRDSGPQRPKSSKVFCGVCLIVATSRRI
jgi:hypothetical protein